MSKHTQEPWETTYDDFITCASGNPICQFFNRSEDDFENSEANAQRIVQCVNDCAGIEDPARHMADLQAEIARLREALGKVMEADELFRNTAYYVAEKALKGGPNETL